MSSAIASAYVEIGATTDALTAGLNQAKSETVGGVTNLLGGVSAAALGTVGAITAAAAALTSFVSKAIEAERDVALFDFNLERLADHTGFTSERIRQMTADVARLNSVSASDTRGAANALMMFDQVRGDNFRRAMQAAVDFSQTGMMDAAQAARSLGMALQNPEAGMRRLRQMNIVFSREQTQTIRGMVAMGDQAGAQAMIMNEVASRTSGLAVAMAQTTSGQLAILQREIGKVAKDIGAAILPVIIPVITGARMAIDALRAGWDTLPAPIKEIARLVALVAGGLVAWGMVAPLLGTIGALLAPIGTALGLLLGPLGIVVLIVGLIAAAIKSLPDWPGWFAAVGDQINIIIDVVKDIGTAIAGAFTAGTQGAGFWDWMQEKAEQLRELVFRAFEAISMFVEDNAETFIKWGAIVGEIAAGLWKILGTVATLLKDVVGPAILEVISFFFRWLTPIGLLMNAAGELKITWKDVADFITELLEVISFMANNHELVLEAVWQYIKLTALEAWDTIRNYAIAAFLAIQGGASTWIAVGTVLFRGLGERGIQVARAIQTAFEGTFRAMGAGMRAIARGENPLTAFRQALGQALTDARNQLPGIGDLMAQAGAAGAAEAQRFRDLIAEALAAESNMTVDTRRRLEELQAEIERRLAEQRRRQIARREEQDLEDAEDDIVEEAPRKIAVEFKTTGVADMWKKAQESLDDKILVVAQQALAVDRQQLAVLEEIRDRPPAIAENGPAVAG